MKRRILLAVLVATLAALLTLYFLKQAGQHVEVPAPAWQPVEEQPAPVGVEQQPVEQPAGQLEQPLPQRLIIARIEAGEGGRVLVNGTEAAEWSSTSPFTLVLEAVPGRCMVFSVWEVNGTEVRAEPVTTIRVAGNTTVRAFFARPVHRVVVAANASLARASVNGTEHQLPFEAWLPACATLEVEPLETLLLIPLNGSISLAAERDTSITLLYRYRGRGFKAVVLVGGEPQPVEAFEDPYFPNRVTLEVEEEGWMRIRGGGLLLIYIPWNYTRVVVHVRDFAPPPGRDLTVPIAVYRCCEWGADPKAYGVGVPMHWGPTTITFTGCMPQRWNVGMAGRRYEWEQPGAIVVELSGEARIRIEVYP